MASKHAGRKRTIGRVRFDLHRMANGAEVNVNPKGNEGKLLRLIDSMPLIETPGYVQGGDIVYKEMLRHIREENEGITPIQVKISAVMTLANALHEALLQLQLAMVEHNWNAANATPTVNDDTTGSVN